MALNMVAVTLNGQQREVPAETSLVELALELGANPELRGVAIAVNGEVIPKSCWSKTPVLDGIQIEILTATQGG